MRIDAVRSAGHQPRRVFKDRQEAGQVLAGLLQCLPGQTRRGGARPGARRHSGGLRGGPSLGAPLDAFIVRKLGAPGHEEFAVGALASGGRVVVNDDVLRGLRVTPDQLREIAEREARELIRREAAYRGGSARRCRSPARRSSWSTTAWPPGRRMMAAVQALRESEPAEIVIAVPAAPESTCREFAGIVDDVVCASMPTPFLAVGESFWDFTQVTDDEVRELLATPDRRRAGSSRPSSGPPTWWPAPRSTPPAGCRPPTCSTT